MQSPTKRQEQRSSVKSQERSLSPSIKGRAAGSTRASTSQPSSRENSVSPSLRGRSAGSPSRRNGESRRESSKSPGSQRGRSRSPSRRGSSRTSSRSPTKFSEDDFDQKKKALTESERRKRAIAKIRGVALDPKDWTKAELLDRIAKVAKFVQDKKTGEAELSILEGTRITAEDVSMLSEIFRRTTEMQRVYLPFCFLNDEQAIKIILALRSVRHLKEIDLSQNQLNPPSVDMLIAQFSKISRKPQMINLRDNPNLSYDDAEKLYTAFPNIPRLNNIPIGELRRSEQAVEVLDLAQYDLKLFEVGIVKRLIEDLPRVNTINLRNNQINAKGLEVIFDVIRTRPNIRTLDLSFNPITNDGKDLSAINILQHFLQSQTQMMYVNLEGIQLSADIQERINRALAVNRSVEGKYDGYYFNKFAASLVQSRMPVFTKLDDMSKWAPKLNEVDESFVRINRLAVPDVEILDDDRGFNIRWEKPGKEDSFSYEYGEDEEDDMDRLEKERALIHASVSKTTTVKAENRGKTEGGKGGASSPTMRPGVKKTRTLAEMASSAAVSDKAKELGTSPPKPAHRK